MSEPILPDQETATLALLMNREVDMRVMVALSRALNPSTTDWEVREIESAYSRAVSKTRTCGGVASLT